MRAVERYAGGGCTRRVVGRHAGGGSGCARRVRRIDVLVLVTLVRGLLYVVVVAYWSISLLSESVAR